MYSTTGLAVSDSVTSYNTAFWYITGISLFLLAGLTLTMLYFVYRYNKKRNKVATQIEGSTILEVTWTVIPILLALSMFHYGWVGWEPLSKPPKDAMTVTSVARMWNFSFNYENGKQNAELVVPVNKPVKINLMSLDVIHSLFIPAFRIKLDIVPGRQKVMWFLPRVEGKYDIFCAEYCGLSHSNMRSSVIVLSQKKFDKWYIDTTKVSLVSSKAGPAAEGDAIMKVKGCFVCHSTDGSRLVGPSYLNLWGSKQKLLRDGNEATVTVDEAYVTRSIYEPNADIVKGYPKNLMQSFNGVVSKDDLTKIFAYLKSLNESNAPQ